MVLFLHRGLLFGSWCPTRNLWACATGKYCIFFKETKVSNFMDDEMKLRGPRRSRMKSEYVRGDSRGMPEMFVSSDQAFRNPLRTPFISHNFAWWMYFPKLKVSNAMGVGNFECFLTQMSWDGSLHQFAVKMWFLYFLVQRIAIADLVQDSCWH